jgi:hypothetical protein
MTVEKIISELVQNLKHHEKITPSVSAKSVAWQINHILKVIIISCKAIKKSDPADYKWKFSKMKSVVFLTGTIPRGIAKAPKIVMPEENTSLVELEVQIIEAKQQIEAIQDLPKKANLKHPYFGFLDLKESKRFLEIHSYHHLKIIKDIVKK